MQHLEIRIDHFGRGADAVGRADDGRVVFVTHAVPGDFVRIQITEQHQTWLKGEVIEVLEASPARRAISCSHHTNDNCGGCPWIAASISCQQTEKQNAVVREISRVSTSATVNPIRTDVPEWGYRRRSRLGYRGEILGFRQRSARRVFDLAQCRVLDDRLNNALSEVRATLRNTVGTNASGNIDIALDADGKVMIGGTARVFQQPSATTEAVLIELVLAAIPKTSIRIGELFSGAGTFTEPLLQHGHQVTAWEVDNASVEALRIRCPEAKVIRLDLFRKANLLELHEIDTVLLDPPRAGAKECISAIVSSHATRVIYVSCDLATLCRDLRQLQTGGFLLEQVTPIDAFPQTPHIECVAILTR